MRQSHVAGEKLFVDYAGTTIDIFDAETGEVHACQLFVAALGASSFTYAEATWTQSLPDWIGSHTRAFDFFGGVAAMTVSDNLKAGITKACFYEPDVNRSYAEMARHYGTAILPARPYKPRDEAAVLITTRWIIAKLQNRKFFALAETQRGDCGLCRDAQHPRHPHRRAMLAAGLRRRPSRRAVSPRTNGARHRRPMVVDLGLHRGPSPTLSTVSNKQRKSRQGLT